MTVDLIWFLFGIATGLFIVFRGPTALAAYKTARAASSTRQRALGVAALASIGVTGNVQ